MNLHGNKVSLRPIQKEDFVKIVQWSNCSEANQFNEVDYPQSLAECELWFKSFKSNRYQEVFAITLNDNIIGNIELDHITWRSGDAELKIRIGEKYFMDQGYGTDAIRTLLLYAFFKLNLSRIYLKVYTDNPRAIRCYQKVGFKKEGKLTRRNLQKHFREIFLMRILKSEYQRRYNITDNVS